MKTGTQESSKKSEGENLIVSNRTFSLPEAPQTRVSQSYKAGAIRTMSIPEGVKEPIIEIIDGTESEVKKDSSEEGDEISFNTHPSIEVKSTDSDYIRTRADEIYSTYQERLQRVGKARF